jgi:HAD superfamily hydrolase (TIGR01549 family)
MTSVQAICFDLDGTLLDYDDDAYALTVGRVCAALAGAHPAVDGERLRRAYLAISDGYWKLGGVAAVPTPPGALDGYAAWRELWRQALAECGHPDDDLAEQALDLYANDRRNSYRLYDEVPDTLAQVRGRCDALAIVTNGAGNTQRDKLAVTGLEHCFDAIVISGEIGAAKPDGAIFHQALRELGVAPGEAWHIGDSLAGDIGGAHNAGLARAVWINRGGAVRQSRDPAPDHEVTTLDELIPLLGGA